MVGLLGAGPGAIEDAIQWLAGAIEWLWSAIEDAAGWVGGALGWIAGPFDKKGPEQVESIFNTIWPYVLVGIAAIVLLRTFRWLILLWRGRTPRVQISSFAWATSDNAAQEATWVTSLFREQLAALRLDALDPLPDRAPGAPLVEIVEGVGQGLGRSLDIGKALGRLFRAVWPDAAYEVWGTLRPLEHGGGRISVQLIERRRGNRTLLNVALEEASWEDGAREAAMAVAGALYPRVRRGDRGPWTMWKGTVPRELMGNYHAARDHEETSCPEYALAAYRSALDQDPLNPNLRLKIAMLQEKLELDLDAWVTYEAIVDESDRRAWRGPDRRVYMLALYRLAVMLSNGRVAAQWIKGATVDEDEGTKRDKERHKRRRDLMMTLNCDRLFKRPKVQLPQGRRVRLPLRTQSLRIVHRPAARVLAMLRSIDGEARNANEMLKIFDKPSKEEDGDEKDERERRIETVLQILSLRRLEELDAWLLLRPPGRPWQWREWWAHRPALTQWMNRPEFARSAIRTSKLLVRIRIAASLEHRLDRRETANAREASAKEHMIREIRQAHRNMTKRWPFPPAGLRKTIHWLAPRRWWANQRDDAWQLHYNAACTTASLLRPDSVLSRWEEEETARKKRGASEQEGQVESGIKARRRKRALRKRRALPAKKDRHDVIERSVAELEEYAYRAGSRRVADQADWLALDDPDLAGLREEDEFLLWASHHLPRELPLTLFSRKADVKRFTVRVIHSGARAFADSWRERADAGSPPAAEVAAWWQVEARVWEALGNACREHLSWQERLKLIDTLQEWLCATESEANFDFSHEARGVAAADAIEQGIFDELSRLAGHEPLDEDMIGPRALNVPDWLEERVQHVQAAYEHGERQAGATGALRAGAERREALRAARVWARLAEILEAKLDGAGNGGPVVRPRPKWGRIRLELYENGR